MQVLDNTTARTRSVQTQTVQAGVLISEVRHSAYLVGEHWFSAADYIGWRHGKRVEAIKRDGEKPIAVHDVIHVPKSSALLFVYSIQMVWTGELTSKELALVEGQNGEEIVARDSAWPASTRLWLVRGHLV